MLQVYDLYRFLARFWPILADLWVEWIPLYLKQGSHKIIKNASSTYDLYRFGPIFESKMLLEHLIWSNEFLPRAQRAEVHFASLFSGGFITAIVVNPPERKLAKHTSVQRVKAISDVFEKKNMQSDQQVVVYLPNEQLILTK